MIRRVTVVALLIAAGCGSSTRDARQPSTSARSSSTSTTASMCAAAGGVDERSGPSVPDAQRPVSLLSNVQVQSNDCVDEVSFLFIGSARPAWTVGYVEGPFVADPSGRPVDVAGRAFLRVWLEPASGVDLSGSEPHEIYDGPTSLHPGDPGDVEQVARLGDFEAVSTWVIGLPERRPFDVVVRGEQLVVRVPAPRPRTTRCALPGSALSFGYPAGWFAELSVRWACQYFDPHPFVVHPATNDFRWAVTAQVADAPAATVLARTSEGDSRITSSAMRVAGFPATRLDVTASGNGMLPAGWRFRMYVIDTGGNAVTLTGVASPPGPGVGSNAAALDSMVTLLGRR